MRDPIRIERTLNKIGAIWQDNPNFRFGQLVYFLFDGFEGKDIFYIEDDDLEESLDEYIKEYL